MIDAAEPAAPHSAHLPQDGMLKLAVGAIGVGGSTGGKPDEVCAMAGIEKIKARL